MIHYMTTQGVGDAWVGNELRIVAKADIPFRLHALMRPQKTFFSSEDITAMGRATHVLYPTQKLGLILSVLAAPFRFGTKFWGALWNALTGERESLRVRMVAFWHL